MPSFERVQLGGRGIKFVFAESESESLDPADRTSFRIISILCSVDLPKMNRITIRSDFVVARKFGQAALCNGGQKSGRCFRALSWRGRPSEWVLGHFCHLSKAMSDKDLSSTRSSKRCMPGCRSGRDFGFLGSVGQRTADGETGPDERHFAWKVG